MKPGLFILFFAAVLDVRAEYRPVASVSVDDAALNDGTLNPSLTLELKIIDDQGKPVVKRIFTPVEGTVWTLVEEKPTGAVARKVDGVRTRPSSGALVSQLVAPVPDLGDADLSKGSWRLRITGKGRNPAPALGFLDEDGKQQVLKTIDLPVTPLPEEDRSFLESFQAVEPKLSAESGSDGGLFGLSFGFVSPFRVNDRNEVMGLHAELEGNFTFDPDDAPTLYGRYAGSAGLLKGVALPFQRVIKGSLLLDLNSRFESDQQTDNYNATVGLGVWGFVSIPVLDAAAGGLRRLISFGAPSQDTASVLTLYAGYDWLAASERDPDFVALGDQRMRFRARYRVPLVEKLRLPIVSSAFQIDGLAEFSGIYDIDEGRFLPEWLTSLEFTPAESNNAKVAFVLTYQAGRILPTFLEENALLAGLRIKW